MNTHKLELTPKAKHLGFLLLLGLRLVWCGVPGPCRHSVTKDHLLSLNRLIDNQLDNGCSIIYAFIERQSLSKVCYIKAAFPQILELLNMHFQYARKSDNRRHVNTLKRVIFNLYSQRCIPEINEEIEDSPERFMRIFTSSPKEALRKAKGVIQMYMAIMTESTGPVDWSCQAEYTSKEHPESTTVSDSISTGAPECHCSCPLFTQMTTVSYPAISLWNSLKQRGLASHRPVPEIPPSSPHAPTSTL
ncbi:macrophage colony-stimulating factor 1a [Lampris incognitus]|uniref:macrophage colony-stimulating factor 1a n=1 Tax=Lampris incognitus TaxID=2546036 RepID=UPI0024B4CB03|nr:macrophage colony-stimulating factor 1a [Lampris incognitus]